MFTIRVQRPQTVAERSWNVIQTVLSLIVFAPIVLKATGVITWSWWWAALSPVWGSAAMQVVLLTGLAIVFPHTRRLWPEIAAGNQDDPGEDPVSQDARLPSEQSVLKPGGLDVRIPVDTPGPQFSDGVPGADRGQE